MHAYALETQSLSLPSESLSVIIHFISIDLFCYFMDFYFFFKLCLWQELCLFLSRCPSAINKMLLKTSFLSVNCWPLSSNIYLLHASFVWAFCQYEVQHKKFQGKSSSVNGNRFDVICVACHEHCQIWIQEDFMFLQTEILQYH